MSKQGYKWSKVGIWNIFCIVLLALTTVLLVFLWNKIPPKIPWFYSLPWGEDQLMNKTGLIYVILIAVLTNLSTPIVSEWTKKDDLIIEKTVSISTAFICLIIVINILRILLIFT